MHYVADDDDFVVAVVDAAKDDAGADDEHDVNGEVGDADGDYDVAVDAAEDCDVDGEPEFHWPPAHCLNLQPHYWIQWNAVDGHALHVATVAAAVADVAGDVGNDVWQGQDYYAVAMV